MDERNPSKESQRSRSNFVREIVQRPIGSPVNLTRPLNKPPERIVQFWDHLDRLPPDVGDCIKTWKMTEKQGTEVLLFDASRAREFIHQRLGPRHRRAYDNCYHPAMQSDYFRLCYIFVEGGCYIDADDVYEGTPIRHLFYDGRLKIQPLCYDTATHTMVQPSCFTTPGADADSWIFYFNNNPLIAGSEHPIIDRALAQATLALAKDLTVDLPEIQSTTGPGNLTKSIFDAVVENPEINRAVVVLRNWENIARTRWELSYRNDTRNWRLSNCRVYQNAPASKL